MAVSVVYNYKNRMNAASRKRAIITKQKIPTCRKNICIFELD